MQFFQQFPALSYITTEGADDQLINRIVPNMTVKLAMDVLENENLPYFTYRIKDTDRPDTVAVDMYGSTKYAWVILLANKMRDWYDWPLNDREFYDYMNLKYEYPAGAKNGVDQARSNTALYEYAWNHPDGVRLVVSQEMYSNALAVPVAEREVPPVTRYQKEYQANDAKRTIRVPSIDVIGPLNDRLLKLLRG